MRPSGRSLISAGYWAGGILAAALFGVAAYLLLLACGATVFGYTVSWCPQSAGADYARLEEELRVLEKRAVDGLLCQAGRDRPAAAGPLIPAPPTTGQPGRTGPGGPVPVPGAAGPAGGTPPAGNGLTGPGGTGAGTPGPAPAGGTSAGPGPGPGGHAAPDTPEAAGPPPAPSLPAEDSPPDNAAQAPPPDEQSAAAPPDCTGGETTVSTVQDLLLVLDHSKSMGLPADESASDLEGLEHIIETGTPREVMNANRRYNLLIANAETSRLDTLKSAVRDIVSGDRTDRNWGLVTFAGCAGVRDKGLFSREQRPELVDLVDGLSTRPSTPLAKALERALSQSRAPSQGNAAIVLVTDGRDTCNGDPCAVAAAAGTEVPVHVVTVGEATQHACISDSTGGRLFTSAQGIDLRQVLSGAIRTATQEGCQ